MDKGLIPRRYAKALFEVGAERDDNKQLYGLMLALTDSFDHNHDLAETMANPFVSESDKTALLMTAAGADDAGSNVTYADFVKLLARNGRLDLARDIARAFVDLYRSANNIFKVKIVSAAPMGDAERKRLEDIIARHIGKGTMEYDFDVDPSLIGGFTVTVNSERLDASVANRLKQLKLQLAQ